MTVATADWIGALALAIPLAIVVGIFIVRPLTGRRRISERSQQLARQLDSVIDARTKALDELQAIRARLDAVEQTLAAVE
jgi:hypothetical protein